MADSSDGCGCFGCAVTIVFLAFVLIGITTMGFGGFFGALFVELPTKGVEYLQSL